MKPNLAVEIMILLPGKIKLGTAEDSKLNGRANLSN